jgi:uncharacterized protein YraI
MFALRKHRFLLVGKVASGTFLIAFFLNAQATLAASPQRIIDLTTYLRDGPGVRYRAVDEAQAGTLVSVIGCAAGWCNILYGGITGYVAQSTLASPAGQTPAPKNPVCDVGSESSYHGSRDVLFCRSEMSSSGGPAASNP